MEKIIPAILTTDIADLQHKLEKIRGFADWVQIDIMDGKFVNNISIVLEEISQIEISKDFSLEAHLMVLNPKTYFLQCQKNGIKRVIFHIEAADNVRDVLSEAAKFDFQIGIALNPKTPVQKITPYADSMDVVVLMSVNPGLQGQKFIPETLDKIRELKKLVPHMKIEVDGGINLDNIKKVSDTGGDYLVVGSGLFNADNIQERFKELQSKI